MTPGSSVSRFGVTKNRWTHMSHPHKARFVATVADLVDGIPEMTFYSVPDSR